MIEVLWWIILLLFACAWVNGFLLGYLFYARDDFKEVHDEVDFSALFATGDIGVDAIRYPVRRQEGGVIEYITEYADGRTVRSAH
jgi:hypothetical protein